MNGEHATFHIFPMGDLTTFNCWKRSWMAKLTRLKRDRSPLKSCGRILTFKYIYGQKVAWTRRRGQRKQGRGITQPRAWPSPVQQFFNGTPRIFCPNAGHWNTVSRPGYLCGNKWMWKTDTAILNSRLHACLLTRLPTRPPALHIKGFFRSYSRGASYTIAEIRVNAI